MQIITRQMTQEYCNGIKWFAMRATYNREMAAKKILDENSIESFIPMCYRFMPGKKKPVLSPAVRSLIFVHARQSDIQAVKRGVQFLQYITGRADENGKKKPVTIPQKQMEDFIRVAGSPDGKHEYTKAEGKGLAKGVKVRIKAGSLEGVEGILAKSSNAKDNRIVIELDGLIAVTAHVPAGMVEPVNQIEQCPQT